MKSENGKYSDQFAARWECTLMRLRRTLSLSSLALLSSVPLAALGCSGVPGEYEGSGGSPTVGTGGSGFGVGGSGLGTGGGFSTGGSSFGAGGAASGGAAASGGSSGQSGGATGSGGGGNDVVGEWGKVEDPGVGCTVGPMPAVGSLSADAKLPDPFTKMDGTRITDKSEWACRREEILQQSFAFIYGEKPIPAEGAVSGTVSSSQIKVDVNDAGGSTSFSVTVSMNGATAPAPAIIRYGNSGAPAPSGVATINFNAMETTGGDGAKSGPFYDVYGSNHPAGYLVAQAWQVSRILDVLEQNPGTIDPYRIGVTGCSRLGKGAFVAGVLDNRIALTIPVESGLGGTVGLRLGEVMDSYSGSEWPYHGISYVRWLSEVALGQFTTGNSASADNTDKLPIDMHEMMALIAPRGLLISDNPSTMYNGLDRNAAWVTANVGKLAFEALGVGDNFTYHGGSGSHCAEFRAAPVFGAMVDKFLKGNDAAETGTFTTDLPNAPGYESNIAWEPPTLAGEL
ncbi:MAG TPA: PE PGRS family protein [Polyangiaceae bacterium]|nr:PE PGRS family protein [Polyangiaceae bacterium]